MSGVLHRLRTPATAVGLLVAAVAALALSLAGHSTRLAVPRATAIRLTVAQLHQTRATAGLRWDSAQVQPLDPREDRVSLYRGSRIVAQAVVNVRDKVTSSIDFTHESVPYGDWIAYEPAVLVLLSLVFALACGVTPWRRLRNLDVAAALSLSVPVVLFRERYIGLSMVAATPAILYLTVRCGWRGLGPAQEPRPSTPLIEAVLHSWDRRRRIRLLRLLLGALALVFVMVGVSSPVPVDVVYAVMEGATKLLHGVLPYGHMPGDVVHGDTYPILSYVLYTPLALIHPVRSLWDSVDVALGATVGAAVVASWATYRAARRGARTPAVEEAGLRAALVVLAFPPALIAVSSGTTDVALSALLAVGVLAYRRPGIAGAMLALAGWFKLAPFALLPIWLAGHRGRALGFALAGFAAVTAPTLALLLVLGGTSGPSAMVHAIEFQFSRGSPQSFWSAASLTALQPIAEACVLGLIAGAAVHVARDRELARSPARIAAISACVLLALQLSANYWAFLYLMWPLPLMATSLLGDAPEPGVKAPPQPALSVPRPVEIVQ